MKYINTGTQAVIETACEIKGGNWKRVEVEQPKTEATTKKGARKKSGE